jgi:4-diphosphocytidyl-2-C-methyl-D-erythritol kinase
MTRMYYAPAKINLWLRVFNADSSGYHPLDTVFCAIGLTDTLEVHDGNGLQLEVSGSDVGPIESNLVYRAAVMYYEAIGQSPDVALHLKKRIPSGAGLGGGSSDAATTLLALQERHGHPIDGNLLSDIAAHIGSDVPFFLSGSTLARGAGRGDRLSPLPPFAERHVLLVVPDFPIATADAYRWLDESGMLEATGEPLPAPKQWSDVDKSSINTFELVLFQRFPLLRRVCDFMRENGAGTAHVSGSGSAVFGLFDSEAAARTAESVVAMDPSLRTFICRTLAG